MGVQMNRSTSTPPSTQWSHDTLATKQPQTIQVLLDGRIAEATIRKYEDQDETTIQIGDDYYGTTWGDILNALNAGRPLEIIPNHDHFQQRD